MLISSSQMHVITFIFVILELMMFAVQLYHYSSRPDDKPRLWYLILLFLLIIYNITGGLFPDPGIRWLPVRLQNMIAYGTGFLAASFFPYYFFKAFGLKELKVHALVGTPVFLLAPYFIFFILLYGISGKLDLAVRYGLIAPFFYSIILLYAITKAIKLKSKTVNGNESHYSRSEMKAVYWAVFPWVSLSILSYFQASQWLEGLFTNLGFVIITILFFAREVRVVRSERQRLLAKDAMDEKQQADFEQNCLEFNLTSREIEVAGLLCRGLTYEEIATALFISSRTVGTHVQNIFLKTEVNKKIDLQQKLGYRL